jgi:DNA polymerase III psi subunit
MVTEWQQFCLSMLEVDQWVLRGASTKIGVYVGPDTTLPLSASAASLLNAMLRYQGLTLSQVELVVDIEQLHLYSSVWVFGHEGPLPSDACVVMRAKGLQQLLNEPLKKREILFY